MNMVETSAALDVCEKVLGSLCIALMLFVVHKDAVLFSISEWREKLYFTLALIVLLANFFGWGLYFAGHQSVFVMMLFIVVMPPLYYVAFIVVMPPLYYVAVGLWRRNVPLAVTGVVFLAVHFMHVYGNLRGI